MRERAVDLPRLRFEVRGGELQRPQRRESLEPHVEHRAGEEGVVGIEVVDPEPVRDRAHSLGIAADEREDREAVRRRTGDPDGRIRREGIEDAGDGRRVEEGVEELRPPALAVAAVISSLRVQLEDDVAAAALAATEGLQERPHVAAMVVDDRDLGGER